MPQSVVYDSHELGWNTQQNEFNQSPEALDFAKNMYYDEDGAFRKREGSSLLLNSKVEDNVGNDIPGPVRNIIEYKNQVGKKETLFQVDRNIVVANDDGTDTSIGLLDTNTRHSMAMFNNILWMVAKDNEMHSYRYTKRPAAPTLGTKTGGSNSGEPERDMEVAIRYTNASGHTLLSEVSTTTVPADEWLTITSPPAATGASGYRIFTREVDTHDFLATSNANPNQTLTLGTDYDEENNGIVTDGSDSLDYTDELTLSFFSTVSNPNINDSNNESPPRGRVIHSHNSRLFVGNVPDNSMMLHYSTLDSGEEWGTEGTADGNGVIDLSFAIGEADEIVGMASLQDNLIIFLRKSIVIYNFPEDATNAEITQVMGGKGCINENTIVGIGNDVFWLSSAGVESLSQNFGVENLTFSESNPSEPVDNRLSQDIETILSDGTQEFLGATYYWPENWFVLQVPKAGSSTDVTEVELYIYDLDFERWSFFDSRMSRCMTVTEDGQWLAGKDRQVMEIFDGTFNDEGEPIKMVVTTAWLYLGAANRTKKGKFLVLPAIANTATNFTVRYQWDFNIDNIDYPNETVKAPGTDRWSEDLWNQAPITSSERAMPRIPIRGRGTAVKFVFEEESTNEFIVPWYRVDFVPGGQRMARG